MILNRLESQDIKNIMIFVCDSLRWDYTPVSILDMGISTKTVASSLYTASSFPSIVSGLYPPKTGVHTWDDLLPMNIRGLLEMDGYNTSLWCETAWTNLPPSKSAIHRILGNPKGISLNDIEPPFIYIEEDKGGHCPYGYPFGEYMGGGCPDFFKEYGRRGRKELIMQYKKGIAQSVVRFKKRIKILEDRRLKQTTLIIFLSDHGELLGEYGGLASHGRPPCPELVYVPTVFIHPSLSNLKSSKDVNGIIRHVDIYPTIASILNKKIAREVDGIDLTKELSPPIGLNFRSGGYFKSNIKIKNWINYESRSAWDSHGGHIFHVLNKVQALSFFSFRIFVKRHPEFNFLLENQKYNSSNKHRAYKRALKHLTSPHIRYLKPEFTKKEAKKIIENYLQESVQAKEKIEIISSINKLKKTGKIFNI